MNGLNFLAPAWAWLGLLAVPLIVLYILRIRRPDVSVSSTLLWSQALNDMRASTPFQKLRRNLLLLLQLLILAALVFTLMRPVVQARATQNRAGVIVIDATASMQTKDAGGESRIDRAKQEAEKLVDAMRPGDRFMLVVDGGGLNHGGMGFTTSKSELRSEIERIKATDTSSDLFESLLLAATSLRSIGSDTAAQKTEAVTAGKVWLFSDGAGIRVPDAMNADSSTGHASSLLQFVRIGESGHSVGITRLSVTPVAKTPRTYEVFVGLKNAWDTDRKVGVVLAFNSPDNFLPGQAKSVTIPAHGSGSVVFESVTSDPGKLFVEADPTDDEFPLDNTAYALLEPARKVKVLLVSNGGGVLENFVKTGVRVGAFDGQIIAPAAYTPGIGAGGASGFRPDLVILDGFVPPLADMPRADTLLIDSPVTGAGNIGGFEVTSEIDSPAIMNPRREDPVMQFVELSSLRISKALLLEKDPEMVSLVSSPESALIAYKDFGGSGNANDTSGGLRRYFVAFDVQRESNWWMDPSLLIFLQNIVEQTRVRHYIGLPEMIASGTAAKLWNVGDDKGDGEVRISSPDGTTTRMQAHGGAIEFTSTDKTGFFAVTGAAGNSAQFAVNLINATESDIRPQPLQTTSGQAIDESISVATVNREVWPWLACAALAILVLEWWVYHRRIA